MITDGLFHPHYSIEETFKNIYKSGIDIYSIELEQFEKKDNLRQDDKAG